MSDVQDTTDPKILGYTQALQAIVQQAKEAHDRLRHERIPMELGKQDVCKNIGAKILGLIDTIRKEMEVGNIAGSEAMVRRDLVVRAKTIVDEYSVESAREHLMLQGEARAVQSQLTTVTKLLTNKLNEESRKLRMQEELHASQSFRADPEASVVETPAPPPPEAPQAVAEKEVLAVNEASSVEAPPPAPAPADSAVPLEEAGETANVLDAETPPEHAAIEPEQPAAQPVASMQAALRPKGRRSRR